MKWLTLRVSTDLDMGDQGFEIEGMHQFHDKFVGSTGIIVAHDIVEHVNGLGAIGTIGDELMALGGIWRCRGRWGDIARGTVGSALSGEQYVAGEIPMLYHRFREGTPIRRKIPTFSAFQPGMTGAIAEDLAVFEGILETAKPMVRGNWDDDWDYHSWTEFCEKAVPLMQAGAIKFTKRWGDDLIGNSQFWAIHDEVEAVIQDHKLFDGQIWTLGYGKGQAKMHRKGWED